MRKHLGILMALSLLLTGCGGEPALAEKEPAEMPQEQEQQPEPSDAMEEQQAPEPEENIPQQSVTVEAETEPWQDAYAAFLAERVDAAVWQRDPENPEYDPNWVELDVHEIIGDYFLYDIDKDGVPELLMRLGGAEATYHTTIYSYTDDGVTELADIPSGHSSFYTWPEENAIARSWGHMGGHFVEKISFADGELTVETVFEEGYAAGDEEVAEYTDMRGIVPDSLLLRETRPMVNLPEMCALTLPIYEYGLPEGPLVPIDPARDARAREAIGAVLTGGEVFCGVTGDGFGGDTGFITMKDYLEPGGATVYTESPLEAADPVWMDFNNDGQSEALVTIEHAEGDPYGGTMQVIFTLEEDGVVYAYCLNYMDSYEILDGGIFVHWTDKNAFRISFNRYQCYQYETEIVEWNEL